MKSLNTPGEECPYCGANEPSDIHAEQTIYDDNLTFNTTKCTCGCCGKRYKYFKVWETKYLGTFSTPIDSDGDEVRERRKTA